MFDIGWSELLLIAVIAIVVVGPRDLPRLMRTIGQYTAKLKSMSRDLKSQFDQAIREAELDEVRKSLTDINTPNPVKEIRDSVTRPVAELKSAVADAGRIPSPAAEAPAPRPEESGAAPAEGPASESPAPEAPAERPAIEPEREPQAKRVASGP